MRILISLPIYKREWILPFWLKAIENQTIPLKDIGFQFELGQQDDATHNILWEWNQKHPECWLFDPQINYRETHFVHLEGQRAWRRDEYLRMVSFRNNLLEKAASRSKKYDYYLSLDSDIILENPKTLETLVSHNKDIVSPFMFMTPFGREYPNAMDWASTKERYVGRRKEVGQGLQRADVVMAAVMMSPEVVKNVRYIWHPQGEDLGFASELHKQGYESYIDFDLYVPHIMHQGQLNSYLKNGDDRG
jgi:hypothetical protein